MRLPLALVLVVAALSVLAQPAGADVPTLTVSTSGSGSGTVTGDGIDCGAGHTDCTETYHEGAAVQLTATPVNGSTFGGWSGGCSGTGNPCTVTMNGDQTVTATFNPPPPPPPQRTLRVSTSGSGSGTVTGDGIDCGGEGHTDCTETYHEGAAVQLTATPASSSTFDGFTGGGCGTASPCTVKMAGDQSVAAKFTLKPRDSSSPLSRVVCPVLRSIRASFRNSEVERFVKSIIDSLLRGFGCAPASGSNARAAAKSFNFREGTKRADRIRGGRVIDAIRGRAGNDRITGRGAGDALLGEKGSDRLDGGPGKDVLSGGAGNDVLTGGKGSDVVSGDAGKDTIDVRGGKRDAVTCGRGRDRVKADKRDAVRRDCERVKRG